MKMIGVYKTNVDNKLKAKSILDEIRRKLPGSDPSFDLSDCDNVLRIENRISGVEDTGIKKILESHGYKMEPLPV